MLSAFLLQCRRSGAKFSLNRIVEAFSAHGAHVQTILSFRNSLSFLSPCFSLFLLSFWVLGTWQGHGARWTPHPWRSDDFALPMPQGAASDELFLRLRGRRPCWIGAVLISVTRRGQISHISMIWYISVCVFAWHVMHVCHLCHICILCTTRL